MILFFGKPKKLKKDHVRSESHPKLSPPFFRNIFFRCFPFRASRRPGFFLLLAFSLFFSLVVKAEARSFEIKTDSRVVAFGDVHGAFDELVSLLQETGIIDSDLNWTGEDTHLVSLGDLIDRGPGSRDVVELMMKLQDQAPETGGAVHVVLGNHELMVLTGDYDYVSIAEFAAFSEDESVEEREELRQQFLNDIHLYENENNMYEEFDKRYPPGFIGLTRAYSSNGHIGRWLLNQHVILKINDTVFVHGGIPSGMVRKSLAEINREGMSAVERYIETVERLRAADILPLYVGYFDRMRYLNNKAQILIDADPDISRDIKKRPFWFDDVLELDKLWNEWIFGSESPLWYRGTSFCNIHCESFNTERFLKNVSAERVVIGHTPTPGRKVTTRMEGTVIQIDTGMLESYYRGQASALIIEGDNIYARYQGDHELKLPEEENYSLSVKLSGMSDQELEDILVTGEIIKSERIGTGITKPHKITLRKDDITINAIYKTFDSHPFMQYRISSYGVRAIDESDRYVYEPAAYRLDRLMDLQVVPVSVLREIDGKEGSVQYWVEDSINESDRLEAGISFESFCRQSEQYWLRFVFDILIHNEDRNLTDILWTKNDFMMVFIDHSRAFRTTTRRLRQLRNAPLNVSDLFRSKLEALNNENLTEALSPYLHPLQIEAIIRRRDIILRDANTTG